MVKGLKIIARQVTTFPVRQAKSEFGAFLKETRKCLQIPKPECSYAKHCLQLADKAIAEGRGDRAVLINAELGGFAYLVNFLQDYWLKTE